MVKGFVTKKSAQTKKLGQSFAKKLLKAKNIKKAVVLALEGELGSGKTTFIQGFAKGLGINQKILSPTFILIKCYTLHATRCKNFYHVDCYRTKSPKELLDLGFRDIISHPQSIVAVEWAERVKRILPKGAARVKFKIISRNTRQIYVNIPKSI